MALHGEFSRMADKSTRIHHATRDRSDSRKIEDFIAYARPEGPGRSRQRGADHQYWSDGYDYKNRELLTLKQIQDLKLAMETKPTTTKEAIDRAFDLIDEFLGG